MPIQSTELKFYKSAAANDTGTNGSTMSANLVAAGVKNNIFPDISHAERTNGTTRYRKLFAKVASAENLALIAPRLFIEKHTPGDDRVLMFSGTQTDTQADIAAPDLYGAGQLTTDVSAGAGSCVVITEAGADVIFRNGDLVRISDMDGVEDTSGNEEWLRLDDTTGVSWNGDEATLTFEAGATLANPYVAANTRVTSIIEPADIDTSLTAWTETSASGTYDEAGSPVALSSIGTIEQAWTLTFTDATNFTVTGDTVGSVGGGSIGGGDFAPDNADFSEPYFTLLDAGWAGTWANGDTITFSTHPAAAPFWLKQVVPAGSASLSANSVRFAISGESA